MDVCEGARMVLTENKIFFLRDHMMDTSQWTTSIIPGPGKGSTHLRGCSTSAPELSSSVALAPPSKELIEHIRDRSFLMPGVWAEWNVYGYEIFFDKFVWVRNIFQQICMGTK